MTYPANELHLGHNPEKMKKTGRIFCRVFAAIVAYVILAGYALIEFLYSPPQSKWKP